MKSAFIRRIKVRMKPIPPSKPKKEKIKYPTLSPIPIFTGIIERTKAPIFTAQYSRNISENAAN